MCTFCRSIAYYFTEMIPASLIQRFTMGFFLTSIKHFTSLLYCFSTLLKLLLNHDSQLYSKILVTATSNTSFIGKRYESVAGTKYGKLIQYSLTRCVVQCRDSGSVGASRVGEPCTQLQILVAIQHLHPTTVQTLSVVFVTVYYKELGFILIDYHSTFLTKFRNNSYFLNTFLSNSQVLQCHP